MINYIILEDKIERLNAAWLLIEERSYIFRYCLKLVISKVIKMQKSKNEQWNNL